MFSCKVIFNGDQADLDFEFLLGLELECPEDDWIEFYPVHGCSFCYRKSDIKEIILRVTE